MIPDTVTSIGPPTNPVSSLTLTTIYPTDVALAVTVNLSLSNVPANATPPVVSSEAADITASVAPFNVAVIVSSPVLTF